MNLPFSESICCWHPPRLQEGSKCSSSCRPRLPSPQRQYDQGRYPPSPPRRHHSSRNSQLVFAKMDLPMAYYQGFMEESDIHKMAFETPFGLFEWVVMPQGLCNAVTTFQRFMNWVLRKYIGRFCHVYIDDILVWSQSIAERRHHMSLICQALREHGVVLSKSKSIPATDKVEFLGFMISQGSIEVTREGRE